MPPTNFNSSIFINFSPIRFYCKTIIFTNIKIQKIKQSHTIILYYSRHYAEHSGYFDQTKFVEEARGNKNVINFYDSNTGSLLFTAPVGRSMEDFLIESRAHGWPSFRDEEVNWDMVRVLKDGETVSVDGTHLGHNIPDKKGSRYCINLVCVAGREQK